MSDEMKVQISAIKAKFIKDAAILADAFGKTDGYIDAEEGAKLAQVLSGDLQSKKNQKKLAKESDDVKAIFGLKVSVPAEQTKAANVQKVEAVKTAQTPLEEVKARFLEVMGYDATTNTSNGVTTKEAYQKVAKEYKGKKEYKEAIKQLKDYAKHQFVNERAQKTRASVQAYDENGDLINAENLKYDTSKKVYKREKELTKANNNGVKDKWAKRALRNKNTSFIKKAVRYVSGNNSSGKNDDIAVAAGNRATDIRENKAFTKEELTKALGKDNPLLKEFTDKNGKKYENVLVATGLVAVENGKYKVKELSKVIGKAVGADNTLNDHDEHNPSEVQAVLTKLYDAFADSPNEIDNFDTSVLKDSQVRDLVEFLGYADDRTKLWAVRLWQNMWKNAAKGAAAGAAAGAANGSWNIDIRQNQEVQINLKGFTESQKSQLLNGLQGNDIEVSTTGAAIYISQKQMVNKEIVSLVKAMAVGALAGAETGAVIGAMETLGSHAREKDVIGMIFDCDTTYERIIGRIDHAYSDKHLSPELKEALKAIATLGIVTTKDPKTGATMAVLDDKCNTQWSLCQFIEKYNDIRGNIILNEAELKAGARNAKAQKIVVTECEEKVDVQLQESEKESECNPITRADIKFTDSNKYGWHEIIQMFYSDCLANHTEKEIRFALRKYNNIPNSLTYVPANLVLPYQLFEGDDECTRTEQKEVKKGHYDPLLVKNGMKTPDIKHEAGYECTDENKNKTQTWLPGRYNTQAEAEAAAREAIKNQKK